jgi:hypothetical protein
LCQECCNLDTIKVSKHWYLNEYRGIGTPINNYIAKCISNNDIFYNQYVDEVENTHQKNHITWSLLYDLWNLEKFCGLIVC